MFYFNKTAIIIILILTFIFVIFFMGFIQAAIQDINENHFYIVEKKYTKTDKMLYWGYVFYFRLKDVITCSNTVFYNRIN